MEDASLGVFLSFDNQVVLDTGDTLLVLTAQQAVEISKALSTLAEQAKTHEESTWTKKH